MTTDFPTDIPTVEDEDMPQDPTFKKSMNDFKFEESIKKTIDAALTKPGEYMLEIPKRRQDGSGGGVRITPKTAEESKKDNRPHVWASVQLVHPREKDKSGRERTPEQFRGKRYDHLLVDLNTSEGRGAFAELAAYMGIDPNAEGWSALDLEGRQAIFQIVQRMNSQTKQKENRVYKIDNIGSRKKTVKAEDVEV